MTEDRVIYEHTDEDGDLVRITAWTVSPAPGPNRPSLILKAKGAAEDESASVRLYPDQVRELIERLVAWYAVHGDVDLKLHVGPEPVKESEPVSLLNPVLARLPLDEIDTPTSPAPRPEPEPPAASVRLEALRLAVQRCTPGVHQDTVTVVAREFETYLRGELDTRPCNCTPPVPAPVRVCSNCEHPFHYGAAHECLVESCHCAQELALLQGGAVNVRVTEPVPPSVKVTRTDIPETDPACDVCGHAPHGSDRCGYGMGTDKGAVVCRCLGVSP